MRQFQTFSWKDTNLKVYGKNYNLITEAIVAERKNLEKYIQRHPEFQNSLTPVKLLKNAPESARRMSAAANLTGLGPMASVAGTLAQMGVEAAGGEAIVENGGDMYIASQSPVTIGIYAGDNQIGSRLAFHILPEELPLAICSSSSQMGHSLSFGQCELATVVAKEAALADSVATLVCNSITKDANIEKILDEAGQIEGIDGILAVQDSKIGLWGKLPQLVPNKDNETVSKITKDLRSNF